MNRKIIKICGLILLFAALLFFAASQVFASRIEHLNEMNDLQNMRGAEATALLRWKNAHLAPGEYWYSAADWDLLELSQPKPAPYGMGTRRSGHALKTFREETGVVYEYDERMDYTGKVLHLIVESDASGCAQVRMNWE